MSGQDTFIVAFAALTTVALWVLVPRYWSGRERKLLTRPAKRGMYRSSLAGTLALTVTSAGVVYYVVVDSLAATEPSRGVAALSVAAALGGLAAGLVLALTITLFNQPKFLVAPGLRRQPGVWQVWWRARRIRRAERRQLRQLKRTGQAHW